MIDKTHPLYVVLWPLRSWFAYSDWRDLAEGKYAQLAERVRGWRQTSGYVAGLIQGGSAAMTVHWLSEYGHSPGAYYAVWATISITTTIGASPPGKAASGLAAASVTPSRTSS